MRFADIRSNFDGSYEISLREIISSLKNINESKLPEGIKSYSIVFDNLAEAVLTMTWWMVKGELPEEFKTSETKEESN